MTIKIGRVLRRRLGHHHQQHLTMTMNIITLLQPQK